MKYLLDTDICIYLMNRHPQSLIDRIKQEQAGDIGISAITLSELQFGVSKSANKVKNQQRLDEFLMPFSLLDYPQNASKIYGEIRAYLQAKGQLIGPLDLLIVTHALSELLILITNNLDEFKRVPKLKVENWFKEKPQKTWIDG